MANQQTQEITQYVIGLIQAGTLYLFYKRGFWKKKRKKILRRDNYECQACKRQGGYSRATTVHHIKHLDKFPQLALVDSNLESLCSPCHNQEHPEKLKRNEVSRREDITPERW